MRLRTKVRALLAAAATATLTLTGMSATAAPAAASVLDIPPKGANDWSCKPDSAHPEPVVLVNGTFKLMAENWAKLSPKLKENGYCVFAFNYGHMETDPIPQAAAELRDFVEAVRGATGAAKVDIVGHSQGGMMPRYYVKFLGGADKVDDLIGIVPSNHGTKNPLAIPAGYTFCPSCLDQRVGSDLLKKLNDGEETPAGPDYTVITTRHDEVVIPYTSALLTGPAERLTNVVLQDMCPLDPFMHDQATKDPVVHQWVLNALARKGPADPGFKPRCLGGA
ncbi:MULTISPECIES: alpha/beta fold hydrolase [Streptomyces]|uniref:alpha/beta fold hydrolase n=1 Tax=Streptomyces TaxID=1883 RepID=UPI00163CAE5D|nr:MULTISPECIES: alpha/beta fold hydrolase [Streptomyces]MBC2879444.1 alpha/beta fold hydrolase [Streptomyces sp. TYQ1024]UBI39843.1 alpha/beta fold hydrolase [Streptomyces mobaraensis]UKW32424.1 lipase family protein [Streptomyces sp. TYQ1024]